MSWIAKAKGAAKSAVFKSTEITISKPPSIQPMLTAETVAQLKAAFGKAKPLSGGILAPLMPGGPQDLWNTAYDPAEPGDEYITTDEVMQMAQAYNSGHTGALEQTEPTIAEAMNILNQLGVFNDGLKLEVDMFAGSFPEAKLILSFKGVYHEQFQMAVDAIQEYIDTSYPGYTGPKKF